MRKRSKIFTLSCLSIVTFLTGCGLGNMIIRPTRKPVDATDDFDAPEMQNKYLDRVDIKPDLVEDVSEVLYMTAGTLMDSQHWSTYSTGEVTAKLGVIPYDQKVISKRTINETKDDREVFFQTNTHSIAVSAAEQRFINKNSWLNRKGKSPTLQSADYSNSSINGFSRLGYLKEYGNFSDGLCNYVINDYSFESGKFIGKEDGLYVFDYVFDPIKASARYIREVKHMSGASDFPYFKQAELTIRIDDDYRIHSLESRDTYNISLMGGLDCISVIKEEFTYSDSYIEIPERADFESMFGVVNVEDDSPTKVEKTAMDYLTDAAEPFMTASGALNLGVDLNVGENSLPIYLALNLKEMDVKLSLDDQMYVYYFGDKAYVYAGDKLNFIVDKDQLLLAIEKFMPGFNINNIDVSSLLASDLISSAMSKMEMTKNDSSALISLDFAGIKVKMNLNLDENDKASFDSISIDGEYSGQSLSGKVDFKAKEHNFIKLPDNLNEVNNLVPFASSLNRFIEKKQIKGKISAVINNDLTISGDYAFDFKNIVQGEVSLDITYKNEIIPLNVIILNKSIYLTLADKVIKMKTEEFKSLIDEIILKFGLDTMEKEKLEGLLSSLNISKLNELLEVVNSSINGMEFKENSFDLSINLNQVKLKNNLNLSYHFDTDSMIISLDELAIITVELGSGINLAIPGKVDLGYEGIKNIVDSLGTFYKNQTLKIDGMYNLSEVEYIKISAILDLNKNQAQGEVEFNILSLQGKARFSLKENKVLFMLADEIKALLTPEELVQLYDKLKEILLKRTNISSLNLPEFNLNGIKINDIINALVISNTNFKADVDLSFLGISDLTEKKVSIDYDYMNNNISISLDKSLSMDIKLADTLSFDSYDYNNALGYVEFNRLIDDTLNMIDNNNSFDVHININNKNYTLSVAKTIDSVSIFLPLDDINKIHIYKKNHVIYADILGLKMSGNEDIVEDVVKKIIEVLGVEDNGLSIILNDIFNSLKNNDVIDLNSTISDFSYSDSVLRFVLNQNQKVTVNYLEDEFISIISNDYKVRFIKNNEVNIPSFDIEDCLDLNCLKDISLSTYLDLFSFMSSKTYQLKINGLSIGLGSTSYTLNGLAIIDLKDFKFSYEGTISNGTINTSLSIKLIGENLYIKLNDDSVLIKTTLNELNSLVNTINIDASVSSKLDILSLIRKVTTSIKSLSVDATSIVLGFDNQEADLNGVIKYLNNTGLLINTNHGEILLSKTSQKVDEEINVEYIQLKNLLDIGNEIKDYRKFEGSVEFSTYIQNLGMVQVAGQVGIDIENKFDFSANLNLSNRDFFVNVLINKVGDNYYIDLGNIKIKLNSDELFNFIVKLNDNYKLGLDEEQLMQIKSVVAGISNGDYKVLTDMLLGNSSGNSSSSSLDMMSIIKNIDFVEIISSITLSENNLYVKLPLDKAISGLGTLELSLNKDDSRYAIDLRGDSMIRSIYLEFNNSLTIIEPNYSDIEYLGYKELSDLLTKSNDVLNTLTKKQFLINGSGMVKEDGVDNFSYSASLALDINDLKNIKAAFNATIVGPLTGSPLTHNISGTMIDNRLYLVYNDKLKVSMDSKQMMQLVRYVTELLHVNSDLLNSFLDQFTESLGSGVFDPVIPDMKPMNLDINKLIHQFSVIKTDGVLEGIDVEINGEDIYQNLSGFNPNKDGNGNIISTTNSIVKARITTSEKMIDSINISNIYASSSTETFDINLSFDRSIYNDGSGINIIAPSNSDSYYDFDLFTPLLKMFVNTANVASYDLSGNLYFTLYLKVGSWDLGSGLGTQKLPITIRIKLDENSLPTVHLNINCAKNIMMAGVVKIFAKGNLDLYYVGTNNTLYIRRDKEYRKYLASELNDNTKIGDLIVFIMQPASLVESQIRKNMDGGFELCNPIKFEDVLMNYQSSVTNNIYDYSFKISGSSLIKKNLGDVDINISTLHSTYTKEDKIVEEDYLKTVDVETILMNILKLRVEGSINNVYSDKMATGIEVELPPGMIENGTGW